MTDTRELDLRRLPPQLRHGLVFQCFDGLAGGESLVLVNDHDPMPLLQQFKFSRPGQSAYEYLERGPAVWRVRIERKETDRAQPARRDAQRASDAGDPETVTEYLEADHRRLDAILPDVERLAATAAWRDAAAQFAEFASGLGRHIDVEEQILFPVFESVTGMSAGPTQVMRIEHVEIRDAMAETTAALAREDAELLATALRRLAQALSSHNMKEEHMLYPMTDEAMHGPERRRELVQRLRAF